MLVVGCPTEASTGLLLVLLRNFVNSMSFSLESRMKDNKVRAFAGSVSDASSSSRAMNSRTACGEDSGSSSMLGFFKRKVITAALSV